MRESGAELTSAPVPRSPFKIELDEAAIVQQGCAVSALFRSPGQQVVLNSPANAHATLHRLKAATKVMSSKLLQTFMRRLYHTIMTLGKIVGMPAAVYYSKVPKA